MWPGTSCKGISRIPRFGSRLKSEIPSVHGVRDWIVLLLVNGNSRVTVPTSFAELTLEGLHASTSTSLEMTTFPTFHMHQHRISVPRSSSY
jgi:hypothetical protein